MGVDTAVVGGGIASITTATKLDVTGQTVAVIERDRVLDGDVLDTPAVAGLDEISLPDQE